VKSKVFIISIILSYILVPSSYAMSITDLSHVHNIKIFNDRIFLGTHEGLYEYRSKKELSLVGTEIFDIMGLSVNGQTLFASGHPGISSKLPNPVGLLKSSDGGIKWRKVSLQGKVDFHLLEASKNEIYGGDSSSGDLFYSSDLGKNWNNRGSNTYFDIAPNPRKQASALALRDGFLVKTNDAFQTTEVIKVANKLTGIDWNTKRLIASSGNMLLVSKTYGETWMTLYSFKDTISTFTQSNRLIVIASGGSLFSSSDGGKSFRSQ